MELFEKEKMIGAIVFTCRDEDEPLDIQLEPWPMNYELKPGNEIKFIATNPTSKFYWALRIDHKDKGIQLFPESSGNFGSIKVYINGVLIDEVG